MTENPYKVLGVDEKASQDEIKSAYRALAKKFHPDLNPGNKKSETQFKNISSAYGQVGDAADRAKFDQGEAQAEQAKQSSRKSHRPFYTETQNGGGRYSSQFEGIDDDILNSFFSRMGRQDQSSQPEQIYELEIDFKDSVLGGEREITIPNGKKLRVKIPAGVDSGTKLRFVGQGEPSHAGMPPGDMYVQLRIKPSEVFKRVGQNLEMELPVDFGDAILGGELKVPTIDGFILMHVPPNVKSGQKLRAKGKGVLDQVSKIRGDQIVFLKIKMPENVDAEFKKAVEDWRERKAKEKL